MFFHKARPFPEPRPFQAESIEALRQGFREGHKNQLLMAATGAGKTLLAMMMIRAALDKGTRVGFLCDRTTLINQTSAVADAYGIPHGIIQADNPRRDRHALFQIASAQTIAKRGYWPDLDLLFVDECHTQHKVWVDYARESKTRVIGLSATPFSDGLGKTFSRLINSTTMHDLTESGVLVPLRVMECVPIDMAGARTNKGEWTGKAVEERGSRIVGDVVHEWQQHASDRKTICFAATVAQCEDLVRQFNEAGVLAAAYTERTTPTERAQIQREFDKPDSLIRVLISVEALAKGFDVKDVSAIIDCRPLRKSFSTFVQMIGRGLRCSPATGKTDCLLLSHTGNVTRFARDLEELYFHGLEKLDDGDKLDKEVRKEPEEREAKACPSCGYRPFARRCISCGFERQPDPQESAAPGQMQEIDLLGIQSADMAERQRLWDEVCSYATLYGTGKPPELVHKRALALYRAITGAWPPRGWSLDTANEVRDIRRATMGKIKQNNIAYAKRRAA